GLWCTYRSRRGSATSFLDGLDCFVELLFDVFLFTSSTFVSLGVGRKLALKTLSCIYCGREMVSLRYFSTSMLTIGPAQVPPYPAFSTNTAMAILGFSRGAKAKNTA